MNENLSLNLPIERDEITIGGHAGGPYFAARGSSLDWDDTTLTGVAGTPAEAIADLKEREEDARRLCGYEECDMEPCSFPAEHLGEDG